MKSSITLDFIEELKEKFCFVDQNKMESESLESVQQHDFELPDSTVISLTNERSKCPELLFSPKSANSQEKGLCDLVFDCIQPVEIELQKILLENVHLVGGNTLFEGFEERVNAEVNLKTKHKIQVLAPMERMYSTWIGGSILTCIGSFNDNWIHRQDYSEVGPNITHRMGHLF